MAIVSPDYLSRLGSGTGLVMLMAGLMMLLVGWIWIRRLCRLEM
jgi:Flp pilus assembly protein TadB